MRISFSTVLMHVALVAICATPLGASVYDEAVNAMQAGDYKRAANLFERAIEESPPWAAGHIALAQCQFLLALPERAEASIARAIEIDPAVDVFHGYAFAGTALYKEKRYDEAILPLERALPRAPEAQRAPLSLRLAIALFQAGRYAEARDQFRQHLDQFGPNADAAYFLALCWRQLEESARALDAMERAIQGGLSEVRETRAIERLARWSVEHAWEAAGPGERDGRMARALGHTTAWRDRSPDDPAALALWFDTIRASEKIPAAIGWLEQRRSDGVGGCLVRTLLAEAYTLVHRGADALQQAGAAVDCDGSSGRAHYAKALALLANIDPEYRTSTAAAEALERLTSARSSIAQAIGADPAIENRAAKLSGRIAVTERALAAALEELERSDRDNDRDVAVRQLIRCKVIHWNLDKNPVAVTEDDRLFYDGNDCRERVRRDLSG